MSVMSLAISLRLIVYAFRSTPSELFRSGLQPQIDLKRQCGHMIDIHSQCKRASSLTSSPGPDKSDVRREM